MGVSSHAAWCADGDDVLVFTDDRSVMLPNAVIAPTYPRIAGGADRPPSMLIGDGMVATRHHAWRVVRWFDPAVPPMASRRSDVVARVRATAEALSGCEATSLTVALQSSDDAALRAASTMLGRGSGLTPEGDDYLMGALAAYRHVGASIGRTEPGSRLVAIRGRFLDLARSSTTRLSQALLRHAFDGQVAAPVGALLRAFTGRGDVGDGLRGVVAVGHSSGPALARGAVSGALAACGGSP